MGRRRVDVVEFTVGGDHDVVGVMDELGARHDGWINFRPEAHPDDEPPPRTGLGTLLLAGPVHDVPTCTWVAGHETRRGLQPDSVGVQHASGTRVISRLAAEGVALPPAWRILQDHPRRGLVVSPPPDAAHADVLAWLVEAGTLLSAVRLTGVWFAEVHRPV